MSCVFKADPLAVARAVALDNLSLSEAAMVFKTDINHIERTLKQVLREHKVTRQDLWKIFGTPQIPAKELTRKYGVQSGTIRDWALSAGEAPLSTPVLDAQKQSARVLALSGVLTKHTIKYYHLYTATNKG